MTKRFETDEPIPFLVHDPGCYFEVPPMCLNSEPAHAAHHVIIWSGAGEGLQGYGPVPVEAGAHDHERLLRRWDVAYEQCHVCVADGPGEVAHIFGDNANQGAVGKI